MGKLIEEEVRKTSMELLAELGNAGILGRDSDSRIRQSISEVIDARVREKFSEYHQELELGQHVHAIIKFFKGEK